MRTHSVGCSAGCGRTRTVTVQDGDPFDENASWTCAFDTPGYRTPSQQFADQQAAEDATLRAKLERVVGSGFVFVDDDPLDLQPGIWKRITDLFRR